MHVTPWAFQKVVSRLWYLSTYVCRYRAMLLHKMKSANEVHHWWVTVAKIISGPWKSFLHLRWQLFSLRKFFELLHFFLNIIWQGRWLDKFQEMKTAHDMHWWLLWWLLISVMRIKCKSCQSTLIFLYICLQEPRHACYIKWIRPMTCIVDVS